MSPKHISLFYCHLASHFCNRSLHHERYEVVTPCQSLRTIYHNTHRLTLRQTAILRSAVYKPVPLEMSEPINGLSSYLLHTKTANAAAAAVRTSDVKATPIGFNARFSVSEECRLLGCFAVWLLYESTFRRTASPPPSGSKSAEQKSACRYLATFL
jgi:hypothetical protein